MQLPVMLKDLLGSKKFTSLLALIVLWSESVRVPLGLDNYALKWLTVAFCVYFVAQAAQDFAKEACKVATSMKKVSDTKPADVTKEATKTP